MRAGARGVLARGVVPSEANEREEGFFASLRMTTEGRNDGNSKGGRQDAGATSGDTR